ncbi:MAG: hypothetical protein GEU86_02890 [Actinophytocola sp.]|nr:hypothetical protein [Actinophytocola sp.]
MRRILATAALLMTLAACSDAAGNGIATAGGTGSETTTASPANEEKDGRKFAQCMRDNGVEMDDPDPNQPGRVEIRERKGERDKVRQAMEKCRKFLPTPSKEDLEKALEGMQEMAECMRANGVPEFPDPEPDGGGLRLDAGPGTGIDPDSPEFKAAEEKCREHLPERPGRFKDGDR